MTAEGGCGSSLTSRRDAFIIEPLEIQGGTGSTVAPVASRCPWAVLGLGSVMVWSVKY